jgi:hypothetical protein
LSAKELAALNCCIANLDKIEVSTIANNGGGPDGYATEGNPMRGKCYLASVALVAYLGGAGDGYRLMKAENHLGIHYWVQNKAGLIIDPTAEQFAILGEEPPYRLGKGVGRRTNLKKHLPLLYAMEKQLSGSPKVSIVSKKSSLSEDQESKLNKAWQVLARDWAKFAENRDDLTAHIPRGEIAVRFVRALLFGEEIPRYATLAYTPQRFWTIVSHYPLSDGFAAAAEDVRLTKRLRFVMGEEVRFSKALANPVPMSGYRMPADFPSSLSRDLINRHCPKNGAVLDPCHGWGGRVLGFLLSHASSYTSFDPAPKLGDGLRQMVADLSPYLYDEKQASFTQLPFEDVKYKDLGKGKYDFALTSPPYFNIEKYEGEQSSWRRYKTYNEWQDGFYYPLLEGVSYGLKSGAYFALQITPKMQMIEIAQRLAKDAGLEYKGIDEAVEIRRYNSSSENALYEVVVLFRKL